MVTIRDKFAAFAGRAEGCCFVLMAPGLPYRNWALAQLAERHTNTTFYAVPAAGADLRTFLKGLICQLQAVNPDTGQKTVQALARSRTQPAALAQALLSDLEAIQPTSQCLVLDNADYLLLDEEMHKFFHELAGACLSGFQVFINGRVLPYKFWSDFIQNGQAVLVDDETRATGLFAPDKRDVPHLEIYAFGSGLVLIDGVPVPHWDGPLTRDLFFYFVDHAMVTRDEIFETFWPDLAVKEATNVFHVTKRKVSEIVGRELTNYRSNFYRLTDDMLISYDVRDFESALKTAANTTGAAAGGLYRQAVELHRYPFLKSLDRPWMLQRREQLRLSYIDALVAAARLNRAEGNDDMALNLLLRAQHELPEREDICRDVMLLYKKRGQPERAAAHYETLAARLMRRLHIHPSAQTRQVWREIGDHSQ